MYKKEKNDENWCDDIDLRMSLIVNSNGQKLMGFLGASMRSKTLIVN